MITFDMPELVLVLMALSRDSLASMRRRGKLRVVPAISLNAVSKFFTTATDQEMLRKQLAILGIPTPVTVPDVMSGASILEEMGHLVFSDGQILISACGQQTTTVACGGSTSAQRAALDWLVSGQVRQALEPYKKDNARRASP